MNLDEKIRKDMEEVIIECPILDFYIFGTSFLFYRKPELFFDICETHPYAPDGDIPLIFIRLGWLEIIFESKWIYKKVYKRRYGEDLEI